jgi:hypothetical protein
MGELQHPAELMVARWRPRPPAGSRDGCDEMPAAGAAPEEEVSSVPRRGNWVGCLVKKKMLSC